MFLKGDNLMPNDVGTVELADRWRRTYVYSDPGPHLPTGAQPVRPAAAAARRRGDAADHVSRRLRGRPRDLLGRARSDLQPSRSRTIRGGTSGGSRWTATGLEQVTSGPHHDVGPAYLPDGRIVFSSTRSGIRDEYHGYQCNALYVMNRDGTAMERIATNAGRDNEPAVLNDGRIAFCRLEMFYARIKTELTLHAIHPDGAQDVVLYGPERREYLARAGLRSPFAARARWRTRPCSACCG